MSDTFPKAEDQEDCFLSLIVCTWNRSKMLAGCLESLVNQSNCGVSYEILVVDDGSTDSTEIVVHDLASPITRLNARDRWIHFLDDDEVAPAGFLRQVAAAIKDLEEIDGIGGPVRDYGTGPKLCPQCNIAEVSLGSEPKLVPRLLGGNAALKKSLFEEIGLFDDALSGRGDDNEWFHRATEGGKKGTYQIRLTTSPLGRASFPAPCSPEGATPARCRCHRFGEENCKAKTRQFDRSRKKFFLFAGALGLPQAGHLRALRAMPPCFPTGPLHPHGTKENGGPGLP